MTYQYTLKFSGAISRTFQFDVHDTDRWEWDAGRYSDLDKYIAERSDGYLYIQGCRITNNREGIQTILNNIGYAGSRNIERGYIDSNFTIDGSGYVICTYHYYGTNQADRYMDKLMNWFK